MADKDGNAMSAPIEITLLDTYKRTFSHAAIALGALREDLPKEVRITTKRDLEGLSGPVPSDLIARTGDHISYRPGQPAFALIDVDTKGMPAQVKSKIDAFGGFWPALVSVLPELEVTGRVLRSSTSTSIARTDTGERLPGSKRPACFRAGGRRL